MNDRPDPPVRDAATVVVLRQGEAGIETFMVRRNDRTVFGPGAYVFPGGAVDAADADPAVLERCDGLDDGQASRWLGVGRSGLAFWVAAVRECFEESGLLLATDEAGGELDPKRDFTAERAALNAGERDFGAICAERGLRLPVSRLIYYSHWITPAGAPRRFSTRFFACAAPAAHGTAVHDGSETVAGGWMVPDAALTAFERGDYPMMPPTVAQLRFLAGHVGVESALAEIAGIETVTTVNPRLVRDGDGFRVLVSMDA